MVQAVIQITVEVLLVEVIVRIHVLLHHLEAQVLFRGLQEVQEAQVVLHLEVEDVKNIKQLNLI